MTECQECSPLQGDPRREAVSALRGYAYQIWRTVLAWIRLKPEERLYVEGAEDYDTLGPRNEATSAQVKDVSRSLSLNSPEVLTLVNNYWKTRSSNPDRIVRYRLVTTAGIALEKGQPFGHGTHGLRLWNRSQDIRPSPEEKAAAAEEIRVFCANKDGLSEEIRTFAAHSTPEEFLTQVISQIQFDTENQGSEYIVDEIERDLKLLGEKSGVPPSESAKVLDHLLRRVLDTAGRAGNRALDRADLLTVFEEQTTVRVPVQTLRSLEKAAASLNERLLKTQTGPHLSPVPLVSSPPPLFGRILSRKAIVSQLRQRLDEHRFLSLTGTAGTGKSTFARLLVLDDATSPGTAWVDLRGYSCDEAASVLDLVQTQLDSGSPYRVLVLDDLDMQAESRLERIVGRLCLSFRAAGGAVMTTSKAPLPQRLMLSLEISCPEFQVPAFDLAEIQELLGLYACPSKLASSWAALVLIRSQGHPQLAQAFADSLARNGWSPPKPEDFITDPHAVERTRADARKALSATAPPGCQALLERLATVGQPFRRDHVLAIGRLAPSLDSPGTIFDHIVGVWVEPLAAGYYRVSPLLADLPRTMKSEQEMESLHFAIADVFLRTGRLSQHDVSACVFHSIAGHNSKCLGLITASLLALPDERFAVITAGLTWAIHVDRLQKLEARAKFLCHALQFRLAHAHGKREELARIQSAWKRALEALPEGDNRQMSRIVFLVQTLLHNPQGLPPDAYLSSLVELDGLVSSFPDLEESINAEVKAPSLATGEEAFTQASVLAQFLWNRCESEDDFRVMMDGIRRLPVVARKRLLSNVEMLGGENTINSFWANELARPRDRWLECVQLLEQAHSDFVSWGFQRLAAACLKAVALIKHDFLADPEGAYELVRNNVASFDNEILPIHLGNLCLDRHADQDAFDLFDATLRRYRPRTVLDHFAFALAHRSAAVASGRLGSWAAAVEHFRQACQLSEKKDFLSALHIGLLADLGFSLWKSQQRAEALRQLSSSLLALGRNDLSIDPLRRYWLEKMTGQVSLWFASSVHPMNVDVAEPLPGLCSLPTVDDRIKTLPPTPVAYSILNLVRAEVCLGVSDEMLQAHEHSLSRSEYPSVRFLFDSLRIRQMFRTVKLNGLLSAAVSMARDYRSSTSEQDVFQKDAGPSGDQINLASVKPILECGLIVAACRSVDLDQLTVNWQYETTDGTLSPPIRQWSTTLLELVRSSTSVIRGIMYDRAAEDDLKFLAAVVLTSRLETPPDELFWAHASLVNWVLNGDWADEVLPHLEERIVAAWRLRLDNPELLIQPSFAVPALIDAINDSVVGSSKILRVLTAASYGVKVRFPENIRGKLRQRSSGPSPG